MSKGCGCGRGCSDSHRQNIVRRLRRYILVLVVFCGVGRAVATALGLGLPAIEERTRQSTSHGKPIRTGQRTVTHTHNPLRPPPRTRTVGKKDGFDSGGPLAESELAPPPSSQSCPSSQKSIPRKDARLRVKTIFGDLGDRSAYSSYLRNRVLDGDNFRTQIIE